jgi:hypothetical protein
MDNFSTGTNAAIGIGIVAGGAAAFKGLIDWGTYFNALLVVAIMIAVYLAWISVSTWWCKLPLIGSLFCGSRRRGRLGMKGRPSGIVRRVGGTN